LYSEADKISSDSLFFTEIEKQLRESYQICNKDSSNVPIKNIFLWKKEIDSITQSPEYSSIVKEYYLNNKKTSGTLPCEIVLWYRNQLLSKHRSDSLSSTKKKLEDKHISDSLLVSAELSKVKKKAYDYKGIPFGISKKCFLLLAKETEVNSFTDEGDYIYSENISDSVFKSVAFNFDKKGIFYSYEIESISLPFDSIDSQIRTYLDILSLYFQKKMNQNPQQSNYISNLEIVQGQLSVSKMWIIQNAKIYVGIAVFNNNYYAKAIVTSSDL
jgi:hypothetical protein